MSSGTDEVSSKDLFASNLKQPQQILIAHAFIFTNFSCNY